MNKKSIVVMILILGVFTVTVQAGMSREDGDIVVANREGLLAILDGQSGAVLQSIAGYSHITCSDVLSNGNLVIGTSVGQVYIVDSTNIDSPVSHLDVGNYNISAVGVQSDDKIIIASNVVIDGDYTDPNDRIGYAWRYDSTLSNNLNFVSGLPNVSMVAVQSNDNVIFGCPILDSNGVDVDGYVYHWGPDFGAGGSGFHLGFTGLSDVSVDSSDNIVLLSSTNGYAWRMNPSWTAQLDFVSGVANADRAEHAANGDIFIMDSTNGYVWHWESDWTGGSGFHSSFGPVNSMGILSNGNVAFGRSDGWVLVRTGTNLGYVVQKEYAGNIVSGGVYVSASDDIITVNSGGRIKIADAGSWLDLIAEGGGYGRIVDIELQSNNDIVLANTGGEVYIIDHNDINNVVGYHYLGNFNIPAVGVQSDDKIIIASNVVIDGDYTDPNDRIGYVWRFDSTLSTQLNFVYGLPNVSMIAIQSNDNVVFGSPIIDSNGVDVDGYVYHWGPDFGAGGSGFHYGYAGLSDVSVDPQDRIMMVSELNGFAWQVEPDFSQNTQFVGPAAKIKFASYGAVEDIVLFDAQNGYAYHWDNLWNAWSGGNFVLGFSDAVAADYQLDGDYVVGKNSGYVEIWDHDLSIMQYQQDGYGYITDLLVTRPVPLPMGETVTVDFSTDLGGATHRASGFLHSMSPVVPDTDLVAPLKMRLFRGPDFPLDQTGGVLDNYDRLVSLGSAGQVVLNSAFTVGVVGGTDYGWPGDVSNPHQNGYQAWEDFVTDRIQNIIAEGVEVQYDIWNEPDMGFGGAGIPIERFFETWRRAYNIIKALDPDAVIVGPSGVASSWVLGFLDYAIDPNGDGSHPSVLPDIISWHAFTPELVAQEVTWTRDWLNANLGSPTALGIQFNEYVADDQKNDPGILVSYIRELEDGQVDGACHACWEEEIAGTYNCFNGSLDGILTPEREPRSTYWVYKGYGDITGTLVDVSSDGSTVTGLAGTDFDMVTAAVLLGRDSGTKETISLVLSNIPSYLVNASDEVKVVAERIEDSGWAVLTSPVATPEHDIYVVDGSDSIEIELSFFGPSDAYLIRLYNPDGHCGYPGQLFKDGDLNTDCYVGVPDLSLLAKVWLADNKENYGDLFVGNEFGQLWLLDGNDLSLEQREDELARLGQTPGRYFGSIKILESLNNGNLVLVNEGGEVFVVDHRYLQNVVGYWDSGLNITDVAIQSDDDIVLVSNVIADGNYADPCDRTGYAYIWNEDLSVNKNFASGLDNPICVAVQSNDNVVIGSPVSGDGYIYHWGPDFGAGGSGFHLGYEGLSDIGVSPIDDSIMVISETSGLLWHYLADFSGTASGPHSGLANASTIEFQNDGRILIGDNTNGYVWHYLPDFSSASGFHTGFTDLTAIDVQYDDSILIVAGTGNIWNLDSDWTTLLQQLSGFATLLDVTSIPATPSACDDGITQYLSEDINNDCHVNLSDFAEMAQDWLDCTDPVDVNCE